MTRAFPVSEKGCGYSRVARERVCEKDREAVRETKNREGEEREGERETVRERVRERKEGGR